MASAVSNPVAFKKAASQFGVVGFPDPQIDRHPDLRSFCTESDVDLEHFLKTSVCPSAAYEDENGALQTFPTVPQIEWQVFRTTEEAATLRKLWLVSKEQCKIKLERLAAGDESARARWPSQLPSKEENSSHPLLMRSGRACVP